MQKCMYPRSCKPCITCMLGSGHIHANNATDHEACIIVHIGLQNITKSWWRSLQRAIMISSWSRGPACLPLCNLWFPPAWTKLRNTLAPCLSLAYRTKRTIAYYGYNFQIFPYRNICGKQRNESAQQIGANRNNCENIELSNNTLSPIPMDEHVFSLWKWDIWCYLAIYQPMSGYPSAPLTVISTRHGHVSGVVGLETLLGLNWDWTIEKHKGRDYPLVN